MNFFTSIAAIAIEVFAMLKMVEFFPSTRRRSVVASILLVIFVVLLVYLPSDKFVSNYELAVKYFEVLVISVLGLYGVFSPLASVFYKIVLSKDDLAVRAGERNPMRFFIWPEFWPSNWER